MDYNPIIPSTDSGKISVTVREENPTKILHVSGHTILNQCGTFLTRQKHLQNICSNSPDKSVLLLYPEGTLFTSIFWKITKYQCYILRAIPDPFLLYSISSFGFISVPQHIRSKITIPSVATGTNRRYTPWSFDTLTNLVVENCHTDIFFIKCWQ